jgi:hypothetical protein
MFEKIKAILINWLLITTASSLQNRGLFLIIISSHQPLSIFGEGYTEKLFCSPLQFRRGKIGVRRNLELYLSI